MRDERLKELCYFEISKDVTREKVKEQLIPQLVEQQVKPLLQEKLSTKMLETEMLETEMAKVNVKVKEMQEKQAKTNQSFNKTADHYQMSLDRLDKEIQLHQKHLDEAEQQDYSEWNKHVAPSPDKKKDADVHANIYTLLRLSPLSRPQLGTIKSGRYSNRRERILKAFWSFLSLRSVLGPQGGQGPDPGPRVLDP